jgi:hypothetical protein
MNSRDKQVRRRTESDQRLLEAIVRAEAIAGIRRGIDSMERGLGRPARQVFADLRRRFSAQAEK